MRLAVRRCGVRPGRFVLTVSVATQTMRLLERAKSVSSLGRMICGRIRWGGGLRTALPYPRSMAVAPFPPYVVRQRYVISTSAYGIGQDANSNRTPLGLHCIAEKIGNGQPIGTIFRSRQVVGLTWQGQPDARIVHRILWLEGLESGFNRGGAVDSYRRYIYIHGFGDETTLGRPTSHGCIHVAARDLMPLFDLVPVGTLVWIG
jgi:hypothetical protein